MYLVSQRHHYYFRFCGRHLEYRPPSTSAVSVTVEKHDPENIGVAVEIVL